MKKILLCIMDGVGLTKEKKYNALYDGLETYGIKASVYFNKGGDMK